MSYVFLLQGVDSGLRRGGGHHVHDLLDLLVQLRDGPPDGDQHQQAEKYLRWLKIFNQNIDHHNNTRCVLPGI